MQTSKQVLKAAINFKTPDRLPVIFNAFGVNDTHSVGWNQIGTGDHSIRQTIDEWGCGWERSDVANMGQVTDHPLSDWSNLDTYAWLDPEDQAYYEGMEQRFEGSEDKYVLTGIFMVLFERMHSLRGFENTLTDFYLEKEKVEALADRIVEIQVRIIENISDRFSGRIDGISFTDDWGTERDIFIQPQMWRDFFKPRYKKIFDACHAAGWDVWMHSCGKVNEIIGDWIETGIDVVNLQQPTILGIEEIGKRYAGKVCFQTLCDIQKTLPFKSDEEIVEEAKLLMKHWGTPEGGFILADYGDGRAIGVSDDKKRVMYNAFMKFDRWK